MTADGGSMSSKDRMLAAISYEQHDYTPCCFMLFFNQYARSNTQRQFVEAQLEMGLDPYVHVGHLTHSLHPEAKLSEWVEQEGHQKYFCRRIDTPAGPLTARVRQVDDWPAEDNFPIFNDWLIGRSQEFLVKPEQDLEKLKYFFGPFRDEDIERLRQSAAAAKKLADEHGLLLLGGWMGAIEPGMTPDRRGDSDGGVMGCDCMAWLSGYEDVMVLSLRRPDVIKQYAQIIHEWNLRQIQIYLDVTDCELIWRRAWYETTEFWTPQAYHEIIAPTLKAEVDLVHQAGRKYGYIITSAFMPLLDDILTSGVDVLVGLDPQQGKGTDLRAVKSRCADSGTAIWGGVSGALTVELGTAEQTRSAVIEALETLGRGGGFVLSPVDNVREDTQNAWDNTRVFIETWKQHRRGP